MPVTVLVCAAVAVLRYGFGFGFGRIWLQELYVSAFGVCFMLGAARAYAEDAHIRIDILSHRWSPRTRAAVELAGGRAVPAALAGGGGVVVVAVRAPVVDGARALGAGGRAAGPLPRQGHDPGVPPRSWRSRSSRR